MSSIYDWSLNPDENGSSDQEIDWQEGQLPATINDSARTMMTRIKQVLYERGAIPYVEYRGYTYKFSEPYVKITHIGRLVRFLAPATNQGYDSAGFPSKNYGEIVYTLYKSEAGNFVHVAKGDIQVNRVHTLLLVRKPSESVPYLLLLDPFDSRTEEDKVPTGTIRLYSRATGPAKGWLTCDGSQVSYGQYPRLYHSLYSGTGSSKGASFVLPALSTDLYDRYAYMIKT